MNSMIAALQEGLIKAVGVSNFDSRQLQIAHDFLQKKGVQLASNQVEFSLINRVPEKSGLLELCYQLGVKIIAYSPLGMGVLSGKYTPDEMPEGLRGRRFSRKFLEAVQPLISQLRRIGAVYEGKSPAQVALNWIICKNALPIPGAKTLYQAQQNAGSIGWQLSEEDVASLDAVSDQVLLKL